MIVVAYLVAILTAIAVRLIVNGSILAVVAAVQLLVVAVLLTVGMAIDGRR